MHLVDPRLPPLLTGHAVKAPETPQSMAARGVKTGTLGAGDLVWSRNTQRATLALVLEPEVSLAISGQMMPLAAVAVAETLGAIAPPQLAVQFHWPGTILLNGASAGTITLVAPASARERPDLAPPWLILGVDFTLKMDDQQGEPGTRANTTSLYEEGAVDLTRTDVIEALSTRLLAWLNTWQHDGFRPIHEQYYFRVERQKDVTLATGLGDTITGRLIGFDETAAALVRSTDGKTTALPLHPHVVWL